MTGSDGINDFEKRLTASLYRFDCPNPFELADYRFGLLAEERKKEIETHVLTCPHCREELDYLNEFCDIDKNLDFKKEEKDIKKAGDEYKIIPFERNKVFYPAGRPEEAVRGEDTAYRHKKVTIACKNNITIELLYKIRKENTFYIINGQFVAPESVTPSIAEGVVEIWQNEKIATVVQVDSFCAFRCVLRELTTALIRLSHQEGMLLSFKLDFDR